MNIKSLAENLALSEVYFNLALFSGLVKEGFPNHIARRSFIKSLLYHNQPPLQVTERDKERKLIFPSRTSRNQRIQKIWIDIVKKLI